MRLLSLFLDWIKKEGPEGNKNGYILVFDAVCFFCLVYVIAGVIGILMGKVQHPILLIMYGIFTFSFAIMWLLILPQRIRPYLARRGWLCDHIWKHTPYYRICEKCGKKEKYGTGNPFSSSIHDEEYYKYNR